jgi:alpha-galactosidase
MDPIRQNEKSCLLPDLSLRFFTNDLVAVFERFSLCYMAGTRETTQDLTPDDLSHELSPARMVSSGRVGPLELLVRWSLPERRAHVGMGCDLRSHSPGPVFLKALDICMTLSLATQEAVSPSDISWLRNGWQSWSFAGMVNAADPVIPIPRIAFAYAIKEDSTTPRTQAPFVSDTLTAVKLGDNAMLAAACEQQAFQSARIDVQDGKVLLHLHMDLVGHSLAPDQTLTVGGWEFEGARTATPVVRNWSLRHAVSTRAAPLSGWCSWYDRFRNITARYILDTARSMAHNPRLQSLRDLIIDDGYQDHVGDWLTPSRRFGLPITDMAGPIAALGLRPGVWVAPFIVQSRSQVLAQHPDWLLRRQGRPLRVGWNPHWRGAFYALDVTNPAVLAHLHNIFDRLRRAGFVTYKLDYLFAGALAADGFRMPRYEAFAQALEVLRDAVGPEATLMGCGCPLAPARGRVDVMRVSTDIGYSWLAPGPLTWVTGDPELLGLYPAMRNTLTRAAFAGAFWHIDPDCLLLRQRKGVTPATPGEAALAASLAAHLGNVMLVGDDIGRWTDREFSLLEQLILDRGTQFLALDSIDGNPPVWGIHSHRGQTRLATYNLADDVEMFSLSLPRLADHMAIASATPVTGHRVDVNDERVSIWKIDRHSHAVVEVSPRAPEGTTDQPPEQPGRSTDNARSMD